MQWDCDCGQNGLEVLVKTRREEAPVHDRDDRKGIYVSIFYICRDCGEIYLENYYSPYFRLRMNRLRSHPEEYKGIFTVDQILECAPKVQGWYDLGAEGGFYTKYWLKKTKTQGGGNKPSVKSPC